jgi:hypothetical protein
MAPRGHAPGGWRLEVVHLELTPDRNNGERIRLTQYGSWVADMCSPSEVERYVPLAEFTEDGLAGALGRNVAHADARSAFSGPSGTPVWQPWCMAPEGDGGDTPSPTAPGPQKVEIIPLEPKKIIKERRERPFLPPANPQPPGTPPEKRG